MTVRPGEPLVTSDPWRPGVRPACWSSQILPISDLIPTRQVFTEQQWSNEEKKAVLIIVSLQLLNWTQTSLLFGC